VAARLPSMSSRNPRVILHTAVSLDGRIDHFSPDLGLFYRLIAGWHEDATLAGSETILRATKGAPLDEVAQQDELAADPADPRPLLVIPDSRGRIRTWSALHKAGHWRGGVALVSPTTPSSYVDALRVWGVEAIMAGDDHVDLRTALEELNKRYGVRTVRVDSGGTLNGVLLRDGLVDEVSVLVHPVLVGGTSPRSLFRAPDLSGPDGLIPLTLTAVEQLEGGVVWLRYVLPE
jgi:2,5-diamino-6-(ribosylamino)-4(3H)-pyrimidinone 5'-phosphate reductase